MRRASPAAWSSAVYGACGRSGTSVAHDRTEHFRITYHEPLGQVAQRLAQVAETSHRVLVPVMKHSPRFRTEVLLTDDTDYSNGSATAMPFPTVRLYLTAPDDRSELNDFDDWLYALFVHEYTHVPAPGYDGRTAQVGEPAARFWHQQRLRAKPSAAALVYRRTRGSRRNRAQQRRTTAIGDVRHVPAQPCAGRKVPAARSGFQSDATVAAWQRSVSVRISVFCALS